MFDSPRSLRVKSEAIPEVMRAPALIPVSIKGSESLNSLYAYTVILKQVHPQLADTNPHRLSNRGYRTHVIESRNDAQSKEAS
ncbi:hypothetical protein [Collimonas silvisoli]|uniref:hypothetical protein n=1 Tax=Collimonas silvisoli TaxID=2825884 RepID=UPI001B8D2757|nr:hypothetical protein [Collimonas silvisoli]